MGDRSKKGTIAPEAERAVLEARGELPLPELLRCRVRYFSDGLAFGTAAFVRKVRDAFFGKGKRKWAPPQVEASSKDGLCFARRRRAMRGEPME